MQNDDQDSTTLLCGPSLSTKLRPDRNDLMLHLSPCHPFLRHFSSSIWRSSYHFHYNAPSHTTARVTFNFKKWWCKASVINTHNFRRNDKTWAHAFFQLAKKNLQRNVEPCDTIFHPSMIALTNCQSWLLNCSPIKARKRIITVKNSSIATIISHAHTHVTQLAFMCCLTAAVTVC